MNIQYQNDLEASLYYANLRSKELKKKMTEKDLEIQELRRKVKQLEEQKKAALEYVEKLCVYDEHLMGYVRGIERKDTGTLVYKLTGNYPRDIKRDNNE